MEKIGKAENGQGESDHFVPGSDSIYYLQLERVTPLMSIGLAVDKMSYLLDDYKGDYREALYRYNTKGYFYSEAVMQLAERTEDELKGVLE